MITKTALVAALILGTASVAFADTEFDANLQNRYLQTSNVALTGGHAVVIRNGSSVGPAVQDWGFGGR